MDKSKGNTAKPKKPAPKVLWKKKFKPSLGNIRRIEQACRNAGQYWGWEKLTNADKKVLLQLANEYGEIAEQWKTT